MTTMNNLIFTVNAIRQSNGKSFLQVRFWENRKRINLAALEYLAVKSHVIDTSDENWTAALDEIIGTCLL